MEECLKESRSSLMETSKAYKIKKESIKRIKVKAKQLHTEEKAEILAREEEEHFGLSDNKTMPGGQDLDDQMERLRQLKEEEAALQMEHQDGTGGHDSPHEEMDEYQQNEYD